MMLAVLVVAGSIVKAAGPEIAPLGLATVICAEPGLTRRLAETCAVIAVELTKVEVRFVVLPFSVHRTVPPDAKPVPLMVTAMA
jgi:hypothetical protein